MSVISRGSKLLDGFFAGLERTGKIVGKGISNVERSANRWTDPRKQQLKDIEFDIEMTARTREVLDKFNLEESLEMRNKLEEICLKLNIK